MVSGELALLFLVLAVALIAVLAGRYKVHPFIAMLGAAFAYGLAIGVPAPELVRQVKGGFGGTLASLGIVILAGTMLGGILHGTGAARVISRGIFRLLGARRAPLAANLSGALVSIPVPCDAAFVLLNPLQKTLATETRIPPAVLSVALATGLYATNSLLPPTAGPLAATVSLGADLGRVILFGLIVAIPASLAGLLWALKHAPRGQAGQEAAADPAEADPAALPPAWKAFLPFALPLFLISMKSIAEIPARPFGGGAILAFFAFAGDPAVALSAALGASLPLLPAGSRRTAFNRWIRRGIQDAGPILAIVAAGGAFGQVIRVSPLVDFTRASMAGLDLGIVLPFLIAAALKTAQGSSTVAIITASGILAPLMGGLGLDPALAVIAIGAGAMIMSHVNDSYFWLVAHCTGLTVPAAFRAFSAATAVQGLVAFAAVTLLSLFM